jgi:hypothetical protein
MIEPTANQVSERVLNWLTLGSLETVAKSQPSGRWSFRLNQLRIHLFSQVVLIGTQAACLRNADIQSALSHPLRRVTNQLPAHSAGNFLQLSSKRPAGIFACEPHAVMRALLLKQRVRDARLAPGLAERAPAQQKENQCQES